MVRLRELSEQFVDSLIDDAVQRDREALRSLYVHALKNSATKMEAKLVLDQRWHAYLRSLVDDAMISLSSSKRGPGRGEKGGWKTVGNVMAAYLVAKNIRSTGGGISQKAIAETIWHAAYELNEGKADLPSVDSIEDQVSQVFGLVERFEK